MIKDEGKHPFELLGDIGAAKFIIGIVLLPYMGFGYATMEVAFAFADQLQEKRMRTTSSMVA